MVSYGRFHIFLVFYIFSFFIPFQFILFHVLFLEAFLVLFFRPTSKSCELPLTLTIRANERASKQARGRAVDRTIHSYDGPRGCARWAVRAKCEMRKLCRMPPPLPSIVVGQSSWDVLSKREGRGKDLAREGRGERRGGEGEGRFQTRAGNGGDAMPHTLE